MTFNVLVTAPYLQPVIGRYRHLLESKGITLRIPAVRERLSEEELLLLIGDIDGVLCGDDQYTEKVFSRASKLKVLSKWGTGIDSIDMEAAKKHGVIVRNTPDAFTIPVTDTVFAFLLSFARQIPWLSLTMRAGTWEKRVTHALHEWTLGIVGVGHIGSMVARRARAFGMRILGNDIIEIPQTVLEETGMEMMPLEQLLRTADVVTLHCDLNSTSRHLLDDATLALMKPSAFVINTSRGPVINEAALVRAVQQKRLAGAALDVFEDEPLPKDSPLLHMENVLLSPHNANASPTAWERVHRLTIEHLLEELTKPR